MTKSKSKRQAMRSKVASHANIGPHAVAAHSAVRRFARGPFLWLVVLVSAVSPAHAIKQGTEASKGDEATDTSNDANNDVLVTL